MMANLGWQLLFLLYGPRSPLYRKSTQLTGCNQQPFANLKLVVRKNRRLAFSVLFFTILLSAQIIKVTCTYKGASHLLPILVTDPKWLMYFPCISFRRIHYHFLSKKPKKLRRYEKRLAELRTSLWVLIRQTFFKGEVIPALKLCCSFQDNL